MDLRKNIIAASCFALFCLLFAQPACAQSGVLKVNVLSPIVNTGSLFYEHAISLRSTLQMGLLYTGMERKETKARGFALTPSYRYYFEKRKESTRGLYLGPFIRYQNLDFSRPWNYTETYISGTGATVIRNVRDEAKANLVTIGGGAVVGNQMIMKDRYALDLFIGPVYNYGKLNVKNGTEDQFDTTLWKGIGIRFGAALGIVLK